jgi:hypothetical protein
LEEDRDFPVLILPHLFLGNAATSEDSEALSRHSIEVSAFALWGLIQVAALARHVENCFKAQPVTEFNFFLFYLLNTHIVHISKCVYHYSKEFRGIYRQTASDPINLPLFFSK